MKSILKVLCIFALAFVAIFVNAWGYQVFWNEVVLNVWQLYTIVDVTNLMKVPYGACVAIAAGVGLIAKTKPDSHKEYKDMVVDAIGKILTKVIWIEVVLLIVSFIF